MPKILINKLAGLSAFQNYGFPAGLIVIKVTYNFVWIEVVAFVSVRHRDIAFRSELAFEEHHIEIVLIEDWSILWYEIAMNINWSVVRIMTLRFWVNLLIQIAHYVVDVKSSLVKVFLLWKHGHCFNRISLRYRFTGATTWLAPAWLFATRFSRSTILRLPLFGCGTWMRMTSRLITWASLFRIFLIRARPLSTFADWTRFLLGSLIGIFFFDMVRILWTSSSTSVFWPSWYFSVWFEWRMLLLFRTACHT